MNFKYFDQPHLYASYTDKDTACDSCGKVRKCFDATLFFGTSDLQAVCEECLRDGKLYEHDIFSCEGDSEELHKQLTLLHPDSSQAEIEKEVQAKTTELEKTTPHLITWQDWAWPCADGDYCKFIGYGSKEFFQKNADGLSPEVFFEQSLYHYVKDLKETNELWEELNDKAITSYDESANYSTLFYIFKSIHSGKIVTVWDSN